MRCAAIHEQSLQNCSLFVSNNRFIIPLLMALTLVVPVVEPPAFLEVVFQTVNVANKVLDEVFHLSLLYKLAVFLVLSIVVYLVRRCLLDKQVSD